MNESSPNEDLSRVFRALSTPARIQILAAIGYGEVCVCHLEATLDLRQAYISQQLMEMRDADLVDTRRDGRFIYYRLKEPKLIDLVIESANLFKIPTEELETLLNTDALPHCSCPHCCPENDPPWITQGEISSQK